jgi:hypothetical protein
MIRTVEETKASIETVTTPEFHSEVTVYHRIGPVFFTTPNLIFTERYGLTVREDPISSEAVAEGFTMGTRLAAQLKIMTYATRQVSRHLKSGKLDRSQLAGIGVGREDIFYRTVTHKYDPVTVHLTVDSSTSMRGPKWKQALKLAAALARVSEIIEQVRVIVSLRASAPSHHSLRSSSIARRINIPMFGATGGISERMAARPRDWPLPRFGNYTRARGSAPGNILST